MKNAFVISPYESVRGKCVCMCEHEYVRVTNGRKREGNGANKERGARDKRREKVKENGREIKREGGTVMK